MAEHPEPVDVHVGQRLKLRRTLNGLTQERLADMLGITFQQVQKYERGINRIGSSRLYQIATVLDVPIGWFFEDFPGHAPAHGLAEEGQGFLFDGAAAATGGDEPASTHATREALDMMRVFNRITDPLVRRRLHDLARALAQIRYRGEEEGGDG